MFLVYDLEGYSLEVDQLLLQKLQEKSIPQQTSFMKSVFCLSLICLIFPSLGFSTFVGLLRSLFISLQIRAALGPVKLCLVSCENKGSSDRTLLYVFPQTHTEVRYTDYPYKIGNTA